MSKRASTAIAGITAAVMTFGFIVAVSPAGAGGKSWHTGNWNRGHWNHGHWNHGGWYYRTTIGSGLQSVLERDFCSARYWLSRVTMRPVTCLNSEADIGAGIPLIALGARKPGLNTARIALKQRRSADRRRLVFDGSLFFERTPSQDHTRRTVFANCFMIRLDVSGKRRVSVEVGFLRSRLEVVLLGAEFRPLRGEGKIRSRRSLLRASRRGQRTLEPRRLHATGVTRDGGFITARDARRSSHPVSRAIRPLQCASRVVVKWSALRRPALGGPPPTSGECDRCPMPVPRKQ